MSQAHQTCPHCGQPAPLDAANCPRCGSSLLPGAIPPGGPILQNPYMNTTMQASPAAIKDAGGKKIAAGVCGILFGALGIHKFLYGATTAGLIMLLGTVLTCGIAGMVFGIIGLIEGIMYLTKSDEEFYQTYVIEKKAWF